MYVNLNKNGEFMKIKKYIDKKYGGANTYVLKSGNNAIIIDAGVSVDNLEKDLEGFNVLAVFITHAHFDHIYYLESYMEKFSPDLYISDYGYQKLYSSEKNMSLWFHEQSNKKYDEIVLTNKYQYIPLTDGMNINLDGFFINAVYTPGHSSDSFTFIVNGSVAFVGDLIFKNGVGRTDFYDGDSKALVESIIKLKSFAGLKAIHSGHGESTTN